MKQILQNFKACEMWQVEAPVPLCRAKRLALDESVYLHCVDNAVKRKQKPVECWHYVWSNEAFELWFWYVLHFREFAYMRKGE